MASTIKVDNVQNQPGTNIVSKCGTDVTLGASGDTVALAAGATQTGFGRTGTVDWQTGDIKTATFTAVSGKGYFCNTTGGVLTVNLPAGNAGDIVGLKDYAGTWDSNAITIAPNGADKIGGGSAADPTVGNEGGSLLLVYVDGVQGWLTTAESVTTSPTGVQTFLTATVSGACNTLTTAPDCANVKVAKFIGPGTFCVSQLASCVAQNIVGYQIVAGGGGGGIACGGGGGGAGGYREGRNVPVDNFTASPLVADAPTNAITVTATGFPITVGAGGAGGPGPSPTQQPGSVGLDSVFSTITSAGGGFGGGSPEVGGAGGSGGGGAHYAGAGGAGNTPTVAPAQGLSGGQSTPAPVGDDAGGGGGGAITAGNLPTNGQGGPGATTSITGSPVAYAGGGGGGFRNAPGALTPAFFPGGTGGGGDGGGSPGYPRPAANSEGDDGTINTGGGGGGGSRNGTDVSEGGTGGSGIVYIRYKFQ